MKKIYTLTILLLLAFGGGSQACNTGCTMGGNYMGILPQFHKNFVGLRYTCRDYTITNTHGQHTQVTHERYATAEVWGRFVPVKNVQVFAFAPYMLTRQQNSHGTLRSHGLGDITLLANYALLNTGDSLNRSLRHTLQLGGGVKLATGTYNKQQGQHGQEQVLAPNLQPGTGSTDFLFNAIYTVRYNKLGLNSDVTYRLNTANNDGYVFGDRVSASSNLFYWQQVKGVSVLPSVGLYYEHAKGDRVANSPTMRMGGDSWFTNLGLNVYIRNIAVGGTLQLPVSTTEAFHATTGKSRSMLNLTYMF